MRYAGGDDVAAVERELGLKERGARETGHADQGIVCGKHDVAASDSVSIRLDAERPVGELLGLAVLVDVYTPVLQDVGDASQIPPGMESRLLVEPDAQVFPPMGRRS